MELLSAVGWPGCASIVSDSDLSHCLVLEVGGSREQLAVDHAGRVCGKERRSNDSVLDVAAAHHERPCEHIQLEVRGDRRILGKHRAPQQTSLLEFRDLEPNVHRQSPQERLIDRRIVVRRKDADASERLEALQQVVRLLVRVTVIARAHVGSLTEQRVRFVEQEDRVAGLRSIEELRQVPLGLTDPFRNDLAEVDLIDRHTQRLRDQLRGHRLAGAWRPGEQRRDTNSLADFLGESPTLHDRGAASDPRHQLGECSCLVVRKYQVGRQLRDAEPCREPGESVIEHGRDTSRDMYFRQLFAERLPTSGGSCRCDQRRREWIHRGEQFGVADGRLWDRARPQRGQLRSREAFELDDRRCATPATCKYPIRRGEQHARAFFFEQIQPLGLVRNRGQRIDVAHQQPFREQASLACAVAQLDPRDRAIDVDASRVDPEEFDAMLTSKSFDYGAPTGAELADDKCHPHRIDHHMIERVDCSLVDHELLTRRTINPNRRKRNGRGV
ncbi:MAG: hypothetical protein ABJE66_14585 [Deltaproteobacteria bacterium]